MTIAFVYKWTELSTGKWYIGSRTAKGCHPNDGYICSSKTVKPMIVENRESWNREILVIGNPDYIRETEKMILKSLDAKRNTMSFNEHNSDGKFIASGNNKGRKTVHKDSCYKRVLVSELNEYLSSGWVLGTPEHVKKSISSSTTGKTKIGHKNGGPTKGSTPWNKGRKETRTDVLEKLSNSHKGKKGSTPWNKGRKETRTEVLEKMSTSHKNRNSNTISIVDTQLKGEK